MKTVVGITPSHCGQYCNHGCAIAAVAAINSGVRCRQNIEAIVGDAGPWRINSIQRDAIERAMDNAGHFCESATVAAQTARG